MCPAVRIEKPPLPDKRGRDRPWTATPATVPSVFNRNVAPSPVDEEGDCCPDAALGAATGFDGADDTESTAPPVLPAVPVGFTASATAVGEGVCEEGPSLPDRYTTAITAAVSTRTGSRSTIRLFNESRRLSKQDEVCQKIQGTSIMLPSLRNVNQPAPMIVP